MARPTLMESINAFMSEFYTLFIEIEWILSFLTNAWCWLKHTRLSAVQLHDLSAVSCHRVSWWSKQDARLVKGLQPWVTCPKAYLIQLCHDDGAIVSVRDAILLVYPYEKAVLVETNVVTLEVFLHKHDRWICWGSHKKVSRYPLNDWKVSCVYYDWKVSRMKRYPVLYLIKTPTISILLELKKRSST